MSGLKASRLPLVRLHAYTVKDIPPEVQERVKTMYALPADIEILLIRGSQETCKMSPRVPETGPLAYFRTASNIA